MAKNVTVTWGLPTTRESGAPLAATDIDYTAGSISVDGVTFTPLSQVLATAPQEVFMPDVDIGDWVFRLVVFDKNGRASQPVDTLFNVPDESAPGTVVNVNITMA